MNCTVRFPLLAFIVVVASVQPACLSLLGDDRGDTDGRGDAGGLQDGGGAPLGCKDEVEPAQPVGLRCCPDWGVDACTLDAWCERFDGREFHICYGTGSRVGGETCTADGQCTSEQCVEGVCVGSFGEPCTPEVGCKESYYCVLDAETGERTCSRDAPGFGAACSVDTDCPVGTECRSGACVYPVDGHACGRCPTAGCSDDCARDFLSDPHGCTCNQAEGQALPVCSIRPAGTNDPLRCCVRDTDCPLGNCYIPDGAMLGVCF